MKMNKLTAATMALIALSLASLTASAQVSPGASDLVFGLQIAGSNKALEVDLGDVSPFFAPTPFSLQLSTADLNAVGSNWATAGTWGVIGFPGDTADYAATETSLSGNVQPQGSQQAASNLINDTVQNIGSLSTEAVGTTANSEVVGNGSNAATGITDSFAKGAGNSFGALNLNNLLLSGTGNNELYYYDPANGTGSTPLDLGTFNLSADAGGALLTFDVMQATPEPSAYALGICAILLFLVLRRRQMVA